RRSLARARRVQAFVRAGPPRSSRRNRFAVVTADDLRFGAGALFRTRRLRSRARRVARYRRPNGGRARDERRARRSALDELLSCLSGRRRSLVAGVVRQVRGANHRARRAKLASAATAPVVERTP